MHYFDNSATTKPSQTALDAAGDALGVWGNPSSVHEKGLEAKKLLDSSRRKIMKTLGLPKFTDDRVIFTSSGTEANNIAMLGCARSKKRDPQNLGTIIITEGEHPSIDLPAQALANEGFRIVKIPTLGGEIDLSYLENSLAEAKDLKSPVIFAGFMLVNNETGAIYDVKSASSLVKKYFPDANIHCDAVQGYMKLRFTPMSLGADTLTVSAHKIHSIRGAAALYISAAVTKRRNITAVMPGGGQEWGIRSGTENLVSVAAFAAAAEEAHTALAERCERISALREILERETAEKLIPLGVKINRPKNPLSGIMNISLPSIKSETMLNFLSAREIYVSAGSACAANSKKKSTALIAFGCTENEADCAIRVSMGDMNEGDEIPVLVDAIAEGVRSLQRKRT